MSYLLLAQRLIVGTKHLRCSPRYQRRDGKHALERVDDHAQMVKLAGDEPVSLSFPVLTIIRRSPRLTQDSRVDDLQQIHTLSCFSTRLLNGN
ncbi:flagellar transcriptional activator FlhD [Salmonella enterica subsp. enterica]|nr:flagellar transcriptional activator FlhD [Salmonella enterica subsp. enterica]